jgi:hypothetical protein
MSRPIFAAQTRTNPYSVYVVNNYEAFKLGTSPTGVAEDSTPNAGNPVIQVRNELYFVGGGVLYQYNRATTDWDIVHHPAGLAGATRRHSGAFYVRINNEPYVCWIVNNVAATSYRGIKYNLNTRVATETTGTGITISAGSRQQSFLFGGTIFWSIGAPGSTTNPIVYNPGANTVGAVGTQVGASTVNGVPVYAVFNKNLYMVSVHSGGSLGVWRYSGTGFVLINTIAGIVPVNSATHQGQWMFTDRTNMYIIYSGALDNYFCYKMDANESLTDITSTVLPVDFSAAAASTSRGWTYVDNEDDPDNPEIFIMAAFTATAGAPVAKWKWNGASSRMTLVGFGGDVNYRWTDDAEGGGHRSYTTNELDILISNIELTNSPGATRINYNIYESATIPSGTQCWAKFYFDSDFEHPRSLCSISNAQPSGTIINGNTVTGIMVGSGINYSVDWRPSTDGITPGASVRMVPWVSGVL